VSGLRISVALKLRLEQSDFLIRIRALQCFETLRRIKLEMSKKEFRFHWKEGIHLPKYFMNGCQPFQSRIVFVPAPWGFEIY
jgi:hypothetical protein